MASVLKRCDCAKTITDRRQKMKKWHRCPHTWKVLERLPGEKNPTQTSFTTWAEAEAERKRLEGIKAEGKTTAAVKGGHVKFEAYAEGRLAKWRKAPASAKKYRAALRRHVYPKLGHLALNSITRDHVSDLISDMEALKKDNGEQVYSASTIAGVYVAIAAVLAVARDSNKIAESPCVRVQLPAVVSGAILIDPPMDQFLTFVNRFPADWRLPIWFQYGCGLRIGEALAINANQFRDGGSTYRVMEQVNPEGEVIPCKWRAEGEFRDVPVPPFVQERYQQHVALFPPDADGYVVPGRKHARVVRNSYHEHFRKAVKLAGLPDFMTSHYLRHRWASIMLARKVDITHVSRWLGHRQIETTYRIYGHMVPQVAEDARVAMQAAFEEQPRTEAGTDVDGSLMVGGSVLA